MRLAPLLPALVALSLAAALIGPRPALAAWGAEGGAVVTVTLDQNQPVLAPDASGGVYFAWVDARSGFNTDIRAVRWSATGAALPGWTNGGDPVTLITCAKANPCAVADGAGGAIFAWEDNRCTGFTQIFARRVAAGGIAAAGWPANGVKLAPTSTNQITPTIVADGAGGAFVAWRDLRVADGDIYLQHVDGAGNIVAGWPPAGLAIATGSAAQSRPVAATDGAGGVFVAWQSFVSNVDIYLQHVTGAGSIAPGFVANGVPVSTAADDQQAPSIAADGAGGVVLAWEDRRSGGLDIYATRVNGNATLAAGFVADGNPVRIAVDADMNTRVVSDGAGGLIVAWEHYNAGFNPDVYASRITATGSLAPGWTTNGTPLVTAAGNQTNPRLASDGLGGAYVTWEDRRAGNADIYATRIAGDGSTPAGWTAGGSSLCGVAGDQTAPQITAAQGGGAFVAWTDARNSGTSGLDIYAQHLLANGPEQVRPAGLAATHHDGQTFLTFDPPPATGWTHRIYFRAGGPIAVDADLNTALLLGSVGDSAATDRRLSDLTKTIYTFCTDSAAAPLSGEKGLFVVTVPQNRQGWYAVTSQLAGSPEDRHVVPGDNALTSPVNEVLAAPRPIFQRVLAQGSVSADVYTLWTWDVNTSLFPAMSNRAGWPYDCSVTHGIPKGPTFVRAHALGGAFTQGFLASGNTQEWVVSLDDYTLNSDLQTWWYGYHPGYDFTSNSNPVPTTGTVIDYTNRRVLHTIRWARANFDLDTTRVYSFGFSIGGTWSMELAFAHPELIAAAAASVGKADYSFLSEPVANAGYNPSGQYRPVVNRLWGTVATNLPSSEGLPIYVQMNDDSLAARTEARGAAFTMNFSGRHDETVGWKEKLGYFESMRVHRQGHMDYWDNRDHSGFQFPGGMAPNLNLQYLYRFRSTLSWPAFSNCSADNVVGDGTAASGDSLGTINGYMDWNPAVTDTGDAWAVTLSTRGLATLWGPLPAPESLTVDVTPRRLQRFHPAVGSPIDWAVRRSSDNALIQSGTVIVDALGLVTIPQVKVHRTGTRLVLSSSPAGVGVPPQVPGTGRIVLASFANPVHGHAKFRVSWPRDGAARVELFDTAGRRVRLLLDGAVSAGVWQADADLGGVASGVYMARAALGGEQVVRRMIVLQ